MRSRKLQIPSSKFKIPREGRAVRCLVLGICCFFGIWNLGFGASGPGFGPPISVPHDLVETNAHLLPERNWIDQTRDDAMHKSSGCMECHKGIENPSMHVSQNVVLGCTDCHGGNTSP